MSRRLSLLLAAALACGASAQVPRELRLQGRLTDAGGEPLTGAVSLAVGIWDAASGGSELYSETDAVVLDEAGRFVTTLGDDGPLDPADFDQELWVSLEVDGGGDLPTRLPLRAAPTALRASQGGLLTAQADLDAGGFRLTGLAAPVAGDDLATRTSAQALLGDPGGLATSATQPVAAVNELVATQGGDLSNLATSDQSSLVAALNELKVRIDDLQAKTEALSVSGQDVYLTGVNLHLRNGAGTSASTNGTGNLIVGYDAGAGPRTGSQNLVVGDDQGYAGTGQVLVEP